jgi:hypothetical protein
MKKKRLIVTRINGDESQHRGTTLFLEVENQTVFAQADVFGNFGLQVSDFYIFIDCHCNCKYATKATKCCAKQKKQLHELHDEKDRPEKKTLKITAPRLPRPSQLFVEQPIGGAKQKNNNLRNTQNFVLTAIGSVGNIDAKRKQKNANNLLPFPLFTP